MLVARYFRYLVQLCFHGSGYSECFANRERYVVKCIFRFRVGRLAVVIYKMGGIDSSEVASICVELRGEMYVYKG